MTFHTRFWKRQLVLGALALFVLGVVFGFEFGLLVIGGWEW